MTFRDTPHALFDENTAGAAVTFAVCTRKPVRQRVLPAVSDPSIPRSS